MTVNVGELVATTLRDRADTLADNVTANNAFLAYLKKRGRYRVWKGGRSIFRPLIQGTNSSAQWYTGYDAFTPPTSSDVIDGAEYTVKQLGGFMAISGLEKAQNRGAERAIPFVTARLKQLTAQLSNMFGAALYADGTGNGGKELGGLKLLIADDPTAAGTVGGISQATNTFWRNYYSAAAATTSSTIVGRMNLAWMGTVRGTDAPNLILADDDMFNYYWGYLQSIQRITSADNGEAGFMTLKYQGCDVMFDVNCPDKHMYFVDMTAIELNMHNDRFFDPLEMRTISNADYEVTPVVAMGNLTVDRRAGCAVIIAS